MLKMSYVLDSLPVKCMYVVSIMLLDSLAVRLAISSICWTHEFLCGKHPIHPETLRPFPHEEFIILNVIE